MSTSLDRRSRRRGCEVLAERLAPSARRAAAPGAARPRTSGPGVGRGASAAREATALGGSRSRSRRVLGRQHVQVHAGADLEAGELRQPRHHLDPPAEVLGVARRRAHPHVERGQVAERRAEARAATSCSSARAERAVVREARGAGGAGHDLEVERHARRERAERHRLVVDRHDPLAPAHLLLEQVLEQVAALGAVGVGGEALALARDRGGHERQRVELRVRVRQRRARLPALVDDHVDVGGVRVRAHALAPDGHRRLDLLGLELGQRAAPGRAR